MKYTIVGAAKSGLAAAKLAKKQGDQVFVTEAKKKAESTDAFKTLDEAGIESEFGGHSDKALKNVDCVITSPGVYPGNQVIDEAIKRKIPIISELEFASRFLKNPIISITGTNGKTTTTALMEFILKEAGKKAVAAGNIGTPLSDLVGTISEDTIIVAETSSYQLDKIVTFKPKVAMILNITPDHMAYHGTMDEYTRAKWKTFLNQSQEDLLILNADDAATPAAIQLAKSTIAQFSVKDPVQRGIYLNSGDIVLRYPDHQKEETLMSLKDLRLPGMHNVYNSMAAALAARAFEVRNENIRDSLMKFSGVEHRLEHVRTIDGVEFINDSKATNINATWYGLSSFSKPIVWIAGGRGDANDYAELDELVAKNVHTIIAIGEDADTIFNHFCATKRIVKAATMEEAVERALENAKSGDIALLSPACKSFDMFMNYEHRGEVFKDAVNNL
ncbi:MAG: UDP-N-acetylmuramoyl-L-alanine--D-glutamate ligase [Bacteroidota bacterium]